MIFVLLRTGIQMPYEVLCEGEENSHYTTHYSCLGKLLFDELLFEQEEYFHSTIAAPGEPSA